MAEYTTGHEVSIIDLLLDCCDWAAAWQASRTRETNTMLVMRAVANLSATLSGRRVMAEVRTQEVSRLPACTMKSGIDIRSADSLASWVSCEPALLRDAE